MQRLAIVIAISLTVILLAYYTPLKNYLVPEKEVTQGTVSGKKSTEKESEFDDLRIELYAVSNKLANLQGKIQILKIAQEHQDWFKETEYAQLPTLLAKAEEELKQAEQEYEKVKNRYARETVIKLMAESAKPKAKARENKPR